MASVKENKRGSVRRIPYTYILSFSMKTISYFSYFLIFYFGWKKGEEAKRKVTCLCFKPEAARYKE